MGTIVILKKTGEEIKLPVQESASAIYLMIMGETFRAQDYAPPKKFIDSILLTLKTGEKMGINPRFIAYYHD